MNFLTDVINVNGCESNATLHCRPRVNKNEALFSGKLNEKTFSFAHISLFSFNAMLETSRELSAAGAQFLCLRVFPFPNWQMADFDRGVSWC